MRLILISFGKLKVPGLRQTADYYLELSRGWLPVEEWELKPLPVPDKSPATRLRIQEKEGTLLLERLARRQGSRIPIYLMDEAAKPLATRQWSEQARKWEEGGAPEIALCVGSSLGFSKAVRARAEGAFSLGPQTLPHELARVVLLEQIYRAWSQLRGHPYHNEGI